MPPLLGQVLAVGRDVSPLCDHNPAHTELQLSPPTSGECLGMRLHWPTLIYSSSRSVSGDLHTLLVADCQAAPAQEAETCHSTCHILLLTHTLARLMFPLILSLKIVFIILTWAALFRISDKTVYQDTTCRIPLQIDCFTGLPVSLFKQKLMHSQRTWQERVSRIFFTACLSNFQHCFSVPLDTAEGKTSPGINSEVASHKCCWSLHLLQKGN